MTGKTIGDLAVGVVNVPQPLVAAGLFPSGRLFDLILVSGLDRCQTEKTHRRANPGCAHLSGQV